jgi:diaminopimelate decarboxylase
VWLRLRPGTAVATHTATQTGQEDSKFGMSRAEATEAARVCREQELPLTGLHFHLGSQFRDPAPISTALETTLDLMAALHAEEGWSPRVICPGGGLGMAYHEDDLPHPPIDDYVKLVAKSLADGCRRRGLPSPRLQLEPGRSLVARAGVALYRVGTVKHTAHRRWLLLDGGLADNPRPALYGAHYSALPVARPNRPASGAAWLGGPYCESGDVLIEALPLPDVQPGELLAVPMSGAYQLSMASNYNGACRPAVVWLQGGEAHLVRRREEASDLVGKDLLLPPG